MKSVMVLHFDLCWENGTHVSNLPSEDRFGNRICNVLMNALRVEFFGLPHWRDPWTFADNIFTGNLSEVMQVIWPKKFS